LLSSKSKSKIDGNQITFGAVDFQPHPPTLAPVFANLDQEMDLTIGSFNFRVGFLGSVRLSDPINSGPSAGQTAIAATLGTSAGSSSEVNLPISIKPTKGKGNTIEELNEIMENLDFEESSGYSDMASDENFDNISNYSREDFIACCSDVSSNFEDTWRSGVELYDDEQTIFSSGSSRSFGNQYQVYAIIDETSEELDDNNNPIIKPENIKKGANDLAEGDTIEIVVARVKIQLTIAEWDTIRAAVNNGATMPIEARREVLLGYHYALHRQAQQLEKEKSEIRRRR
jgi:hypothetical protein